MSADFDQENLTGIFVAEASDGMDGLTKALHPAGESLPTQHQLQDQFIIAHRIRGAASLYGYGGITQLCERLESMLERAMSIPAGEWPRAVGAMREIVQGIQTLVQAISVGGSEDQTVVERCLASSAGLLPDDSSPVISIPAAAVTAAEPGAALEDNTGSVPTELDQGSALLTQAVGLGETEVGAAHSARQPAVEQGSPGEHLSAVSPESWEYIAPDINAEVMSYFVPEAEEYLTVILGLISTLRADASDAAAIQQLFRTAHTLKGSAYTVGFQVIGDIAHPMEECMIGVREQRISLRGELFDTFIQAVGLIRSILRRDSSLVGRLQNEVPGVIGALSRLRDGQSVELPVAPVHSPAADSGSAHGLIPEKPEAEATVAADQAPTLSDDYFLPQLDPEVLSYFAPEAQEYLESLEANLLQLDKDTQNRELINQLFRTAHTLKGSAYTVGFQAIGDLIHHVEDFMGAVRDNRLAVMPGHTDLILHAVDVVRVLMRRDPRIVDMTRQRFQAALSELNQLESGHTVAPSSATQADAAPVRQAVQSPGLGEEQGQSGRQAESKPGEEREVIRVSYARLEQLMNLVGELVIGRDRLEQRLRALEQLSDQVLACKTRLVDSVQTFADKHMFTFQSAPAGPVEQAAQGGRRFGDFGALELDKYDDFNILARRIGEVSTDITESMVQLNGSIRRAHDDMSHLQQLTRNMRDEIARARMVPIGTPFTRFRRAIREVARASKKEVSLITSGEHTEVDTGVVERLVDPLVHLVRNAVYHGIEPPSDRIARGKPASGSIYLHAAHRGNSIIIEVEDDGAGLDLQKIREKAVAVGLARPDQIQALTDADTLQYIFEPGFSTADKIGDQAGRGVGLDVVKRVIESMNGHVEVESLPGIGTKFTLNLPLTLLITTALYVRVGTERYAIALSNIREVTLPTAASLTRTEDRALLHLDEEVIEVQSLGHLLRREPGPVEGTMPVVIVRAGAGLLGLAVDELLGRQEIVIKTLGSLKSFERSCFGGATIDPEGRVVLVVDPSRLGVRQPSPSVVQGMPSVQAHPEHGSTPSVPIKETGAVILLIDDSLSIRKFVGRMLESAGYPVDTAVDGEDGLRKASERDYRMIITDLEMPKFNGYEVVQALRGRPQTQRTPIVVMTTRAGDKHRQLAIDVGANSYIAKPVDERTLLQEVERWVGRTPAILK